MLFGPKLGLFHVLDEGEIEISIPVLIGVCIPHRGSNDDGSSCIVLRASEHACSASEDMLAIHTSFIPYTAVFDVLHSLRIIITGIQSLNTLNA